MAKLSDTHPPEELDAELALLRTIVSLFVFRPDGTVSTVNETGLRVLGKDRADVVGAPFGKFLVGGDTDAFAMHLQSAIGQSARSTVELRLGTKEAPRHVRLESIPSNDGGVISVLTDVSDQRHMQDQLLQAQKMEAMGRLAGGMAHDFNNALMAILGYTELLLLRHSLDDEARRAVEMIQKTGERTQSLTKQLVAFSRKQVIEHRALAVGRIVREVGAMLERMIGEDIRLETSCATGLWKVKADAGQLQQVLMNLAVNARDAMPTGGALTIEATNTTLEQPVVGRFVRVAPGDYVRVVVSDTGSGIDPDVISHVFEPFFTTKPKGKGTGLGLSTVFGTVEQSGGHIDVESSLGSGTTFTVYLPRFVDMPSQGSKKAKSDYPAKQLAGRPARTVLLVEDEDAVRSVISDMLSTAGYTVLEASHPGEALHVADQFQGRIDMMLTDVVMPGMGGRPLAEKLQSVRPDLKVLFMSGHTEDAILRHGVREALYSFIQKPFSMDVLLRTVRGSLEE